MKKLLTLLLTVFIFGCQDTKESEYEKLHDKYRTLWYRTGQQCFYDSSRKYGLLYEYEKYGHELGISIDTIPTGETPSCK